jgi:hypothetical protein
VDSAFFTNVRIALVVGSLIDMSSSYWYGYNSSGD